MNALTRTVLLVLFLITLLTWLLLHSMGPRGEDYVLAQRDVARVSLAEAGLRRDVLEARAGLLRDYDPLVDDSNALRESAAELHQQAHVPDDDRRLLDGLVDIADKEDAALENFKTDNALLQNSLSFFNLLDQQIGGSDASPEVLHAVAELGDGILYLTRDPSPAIQDMVRGQLQTLASVNRPRGPLSTQIDLLAAHGRLLTKLLPAVDADLQTLFRLSTYDLRQAIRAGQDERRHVEEARAVHFRVGLYIVALLLLAVLVRVGLQWRSGLQLLRQRSELEYLIADVSAKVIAASLDDHDRVLDRMLARLGEGFGAERAYLVYAADTLAPRSWSRADTPFLATWAHGILDAAFAGDEADKLIDIPIVAAHRDDRLRGALLAAGAGSWCGVVLSYSGKRAGLLAFDRSRPMRAWPRGGSGLVRMAAEVVQNMLYRQEAARSRLELEARLARAKRLEALGTFASGIAHNFNNVVGAVLGHAEMAAGLLPVHEPASYHLDMIHVAGERAQDLVRRILDFGRRESAPHQSLSVEGLVADSLSMLKVLLPAGIDLKVDPGPPGLYVRGDGLQLQQVIVNLVKNAQEAIAREGAITLSVDAQTVTGERLLSHDVLRPGYYVRLRVSDTGAGMDGATLAKIFEPFFTSRPAGTGLGLATVREIVDDHQGGIDVRSASGRGTMFAIFLSAGSPAGDARASERGNGEVVLLCSADAAALARDEETLAALGYEPVGFRGVDAALAAVRAQPDRFDAMLLDASGLDGDSVAAIADLRRSFPNRLVVVVGRVTSNFSSAALASLGVREVLQRPLRSSQLAAALSRQFVVEQ